MLEATVLQSFAKTRDINHIHASHALQHASENRVHIARLPWRGTFSTQTLASALVYKTKH
jgi:hypothetical protein